MTAHTSETTSGMTPPGEVGAIVDGIRSSEAIFRAPHDISLLGKKVMDRLIRDIPERSAGFYYVAALNRLSSGAEHDVFLLLGPQTNGFVLLGLTDGGKTGDDLNKIAVTIRDAAVRGLPAYISGMEMSESDREKRTFRISCTAMSLNELLQKNFWKTGLSYGLPPNDVERKWVQVSPEAFLPFYHPSSIAASRHVYEPQSSLEWERIQEICMIALDTAAKGRPFVFAGGVERSPDSFCGRHELLPIFLLAAVIHWRWGRLVSGGASFLIAFKADDMIDPDEEMETMAGYLLTGFETDNMGLASLVLGDLVRRNRIRLDDGREGINGSNILYKAMKWLDDGGYSTGKLREAIGMEEML